MDREQPTWSDPAMPVPRRILFDLGYFGHFLHVHTGGRSGKQHILTKLLHEGGLLTQRELLDSSGVSSAALSEVLGKLESEGLVERTRSKEDRRQLEVRLTAEGRFRAHELEGRKAQFERDAVTVLSDDEQRDLLATLDRLAAHWQEIEDRERTTGCQNNNSNSR